MTALAAPPPAATPPPATTEPTPPPATGLLLTTVLKFREFGIVLAIVLLVMFTTVGNSEFVSGQNIRDLALGTSIAMVLAIGQSVVVITRNIDLSVGAVLGLSAYAVGRLVIAHSGLPIVLVLLAGLAIGAGLGLLNGILVRYGNVPALVVTLGTLYIFRGATSRWAGGDQITNDEIPNHIVNFGVDGALGVPYLVLVALLLLAAASVFMRNYRTGRKLYAIGSDPDAAKLAGIPVGRLTLAAFVFSGALAGLAGVLYMARFGGVDPAAAGQNLELESVAAVVVGGVAIFGGSGSVLGAALGALLLTMINSSLAILQLNQFWQQAIVGALILLAIGLDRLVSIRAANAQRHADSQRRSLAHGR